MAVATPAQNRLAIEAALKDGGTCTLAPGLVVIDQAPALAPNSTLIGHSKGTTLRNLGQGPTLGCWASGLGYTQADHVSGPVAVGEYLFRFQYDWQLVGSPRPVLCRVVKVGTGGYQTEPRLDGSYNAVLRFRKAWPCGSPAEGDDRVTLTVPSDGLSVGQWVFVSDGPAVANAGRGEHRRVVAIEGAVVRLDCPLRQTYGPAVLAWIEPVVGVTVENLTVEAQPNGNPIAWAAAFKGCVALQVENVTFAGACDLITCSDIGVYDCRGPAVQINTSSNIILWKSTFGAFYAEESTFDIDAYRCTFGPGRDPGANCVTAFFACDRLYFDGVKVVGAGRAQWPPPSAFNVAGNGNTFSDIEVSASKGGWSLFGGNGAVIRGFKTDGAFQFLKGQKASLHGIRGTYVELVDGQPSDGNTLVDGQFIKAGVGWQASSYKPWPPNDGSVGAASAKPEAVSGGYLRPKLCHRPVTGT